MTTAARVERGSGTAATPPGIKRTMRAPFYEAPAISRRAGKRILLLAYFFPPAEAAGALRWQKLARHFAAEGWSFDVITLDPTALQSRDESRLSDLPPGTRVFAVEDGPVRSEALMEALWTHLGTLRARVRSRGAANAAPIPSGARAGQLRPTTLGAGEIRWELGTARGWRRLLGAWWSHERHRGWIDNAEALAGALMTEETYSIIISCGPPHHAHRLARRLSRRHGVPFVIDLRDPWSHSMRLHEHCATPLWWRLARLHESRCVSNAGLVVANTESAAEQMRAQYPRAHDRIVAVPNGCDEDEPLPELPRDPRFRVVYAGSVYLDRDPRPLFRAAAQLIRERALDPTEMSLEFIGHAESFAGVPLPALAEQCGIRDYVHVRRALPRDALMAELARAAVLVSLPQDLHHSIPSKIYEYLRFPVWLLILADRGSATERLLRRSTADVVMPTDEAGILATLRTRLDDFRRGVVPAPVAESGRFGREDQAASFLDAISRHISLHDAARADTAVPALARQP